MLDLQAVELRNVVDVADVLHPRVPGRDAQHLVVATGLVTHPEHADRSALDEAAGECGLSQQDKGVKAGKGRLMGFGHRVYKNFDPRAKLMRETCYEVLKELGLENDPLFKLAMTLEKIALEDEYFVSRKLYPNVDFYSGIVQRALGVPTEMFTCIFALARTVGWISQWEEMITDAEYKIGRPRQLFVGHATRAVQPIAKR